MTRAPEQARDKGWLPLLAKAVTFTALIGLGVPILAGIVLWDADFNLARDKFENFKLAMFGKWQPNRKSEVTDLLDGVAEFNFFKRKNVAGFGSVMTGAKFNSSEDVINKRPTKRWCYVSTGHGVASRHIELGTQEKSAAPRFSDFQTIPKDVLDELGVTAFRLSALAKANCQFATPDPTEKKD